MGSVLTIREAVKRANADGMPISEYTLRRWVKSGVIPARVAGTKALIFYPNLVRYITCEGSAGGVSDTDSNQGVIRRIDEH